MEPEEIEAHNLLRKIKILESFIDSKKYVKLRNREKNLCHRQLGAMQTYHKCLSERIAMHKALEEELEEIDVFGIICHDHQEVACEICFGELFRSFHNSATAKINGGLREKNRS